MEEIIEHFSHEHSLRRIPNVAEDMARMYWCFGCWRSFLAKESGYGCSVNCGYPHCLHEECATMAREIKHAVHPSHPLTQKILDDVEFTKNTRCAICNLIQLGNLGYVCVRGCELWIHLHCAGGLVVADEQVMNHPSHPHHELKFLNRSCVFRCDACGTAEKGKSYVCRICQYWVHESCASLPTTMLFNHHPDHFLSLAFHLPLEYIEYEYSCDICGESLPLTYWVYHCELCRYVIHVKCATNTSHAATSNQIKNENAVDDERRDILKVPINDMYEEVIRSFVKRKRGEIFIPRDNGEIITTYKFHNHLHSLSFISFSLLPSSHYRNNEEDEDDDDDDDDDNEISELICDGCSMPIQQKPSTSCSYSYESGYMSCGECKYFLHLACFNLPQHLPSNPLHPFNDHHLELQSRDKLKFVWCSFCRFPTNGLFYGCTECGFIVDLKCISLPETIKHAGHPHNDLKLVPWKHGRGSSCLVCQSGVIFYYRCDKCTFRVCRQCVQLPANSKHRLEKHVLPLTYNASVNHPDEFYCASCEQIMNPKSWMYHCRDCDQSFHPECCPATSGEYRNVNFGRQQYQVSHHPQHPLRFQLISKKKRCNVCHYVAYNGPGYQCTSCNFVMCSSFWHDAAVKPID